MEEMLKKLMLQKLVRAKMWGGKHTPLNFVLKSIPQHYRNTHKGQREVENALKELVNCEWIILVQKRTGRGSAEHIALNPRKVQEIAVFLQNS